MIYSKSHRAAAQIAVLINQQNKLAVKFGPEQIEQTAAKYIVLEVPPLVLGCVAVEAAGHSLCEIKHLSVMECFQGIGLGRRLLTRALTMVRTPFVYATIRQDNLASRALFRRFGFQEAFTPGDRLVLATKVMPARAVK